MLLRTEYREEDSWSTWLKFDFLVFENIQKYVLEGKLTISVYAFLYACTYMCAYLRTNAPAMTCLNWGILTHLCVLYSFPPIFLVL